MKEWSNAALYVVAIIVFIITLSLYFKLKNDDSAVEFSTYCEKAVYNLFTGDTSRYLETHRDNYDYMDFDIYWTVMNNWTDYEFECHSNGGEEATVKARERKSNKNWDDWYDDWYDDWEDDEPLEAGSVFYTESLSSGSEIEE